MARLIASALAVVSLPLSALGQEMRQGSEFQVNSFTTSHQYGPAVAADADGDFVAAWGSSAQDGSGMGVFARRFSRAGVALAGEFQVNVYTDHDQRSPAVAVDADGDFVVVWISLNQDGSGYGIFGRRFSSAGLAQATEFQVNTRTTDGQAYPSVAMDASGDFVVAWQSNSQDGTTYNGYGIFARRFSSAGVALGSELQINTYTTNDQTHPSVAADADGDFVVVFQSNTQDWSGWGVFARRFSSTGMALGIEFQVNVYTMYAQRYPSVASEADGDFLVAWEAFGEQDGSYSGVFARHFSNAGVSLLSDLQVTSYTTGLQLRPSVAAVAEGGFVVAWQSSLQDGSGDGVFARRFSNGGVAVASEFQVSTYTTDYQNRASVAADASGDFVVLWQSYYQDGSQRGVFAQRFGTPPSLDVDGNGSVDALTDGLLVLRSLFGFTGMTLTSGAVGGGCTRCAAATIEPYIGGLGLTLDIDGNATVDALTDGLLVLRSLFGFTGTTLTSGAVGGGCTRCVAASIELHLAGLI